MLIPAIAIILLALFLFLRKLFLKAPLPNTMWRLFNRRNAVPLTAMQLQKLEGIYSIEDGKDFFGTTVVLKSTYVVQNDKPVHHLSFFMEKDVTYFICEAKRLRRKILLNGYWSKVDRATVGRVRMIIRRWHGGRKIVRDQHPDRIIITGRFGNDNDPLRQHLVLKYKQPLSTKFPFYILGHRGAGRNIDFYPYSENSLESIRLAALLGATGVEIDVRLTEDNIPVLFHDFVLSARSIEYYTLAELFSSTSYERLQEVRLKKGEAIPTLREALDVILYETHLELVWLDMKYDGDQMPVREIQKEYYEKAIAAKRKLDIYIGIPDGAALKKFLELPGHNNVPSLCELKPSDVRNTNASIWAPKWNSINHSSIEDMKKDGRKVFTWTVDDPSDIKRFMYDGRLDGILSNMPSLVAFYYYTA